MKTTGSIGWFVSKVFRPFTAAHILVLVLFCVSVGLTIWWGFYANAWSSFWSLMAVLSIVSGILSILILLAKYTIYAFFSKYENDFAQNFRSGFLILFVAGILSLLWNIVHTAINNFYLPKIAKEEGIKEFQNLSAISSTVDALIGVILALLILYASYRLLLGLEYYNNRK